MALTQVTSIGIKNGEIVNDDLHSAAAIVLSKLNTTGTASSSTFLRGDGAWTAISADGGNAATLDSIDSSQFLRSDASDTMSGILSLTSSSQYPLTINGSHDGKIVLQGSNNPYIRFKEGTTDKAYIQWNQDGFLDIKNEEDSSRLLIRDNLNFSQDAINFKKIWNEYNDGSGSGLDADTLDGQQGSYYQNASNLNAGTVSTSRLPKTEGGVSIVGNFGQWQGHSTYQNFNTVPSYWGWNYMNGSTNGPNSNSAQWYRNRVSLGSEYGFGSDSGDYWLEMAYPRYSHTSAGGLWIRTCEAGSEGSWHEVGTKVSGNHTIWHAGNDGSGSGLDADQLDGVGANKFLTSYANAGTTGWQNSNANFRFNGGSSGANGLAMHASDGDFLWQLYGGGTTYGFLNANWGGWDLKKTIDGQLQLRIGGTDYTVWNQQNDGSGSGLDADTLDGVQGSSFLRSDASDSATGTLTVRDVKLSAGYHLQRSDHHSGHLEGSYNNIGANSYKSNPIYSIGSSYNPADAALSNFYGIGYSNKVASFINFTGSHGWGMYVAADGDARVWLDGSNGVISSTGHHYVGSNVVFNAGNDGSGSGLDADTVDGIQGGSFVRADTNDNVIGGPWQLTNTGTSNWGYRFINSTGTNNSVYMAHGTHGMHIRNDSAGTGNYLLQVYGSNGTDFKVRGGDALATSGGNTMWHAGNDGSGSGLDADTCDGQHLGTGSSPTFENIYSNDWFRNSNSTEGMYNQSTTQHLYSDHDDVWNISGGTSANWIRFRDEHAGTIRGYVGANTSFAGFLDSAGNWAFSSNQYTNYSYRDLACSPDGNHDLGYGNRRWDNVYATNGTIQTSDRNEKENIVATDLGLDFVNKLSPVSFKRKGKTRTHYGFIAQDIEQILTDIGKTTTQFAPLIKSDISEAQDGSEYRYGLRYEQLLAPVVKAIQELAVKVAALESA